MANIVLPPSPNWFHPNTISCNEKEKLYVTASFKNIVIYAIDNSTNITSIRPQMTIAFNYGKVKGLSIYPFELGNYKRTVIAFSDLGGLSLINCDTGKIIEQKLKITFNSVCWAVVDGEECVAAVGSSGLLTIWTPSDSSLKSTRLHDRKNLNLIQPIPFNRGEALVASDNHILHVNLKGSSILRTFKGHQQDIYCISWCDRPGNPLETDLEFSRDTSSDTSTDSSAHPTENGENTLSSTNGDDGEMGFFASSDFNKNIIIWDFKLGRFVEELEQKGKQRPKEKQKNLYHISLLWIKNRLYSSTVTGEVLVWTLREKDHKSRTLYDLHSRVIYNLSKAGHTVISYSQDRQICGFDVNSKKTVFEIPTIGTCPRTMAFNPHDPSRLAIGFQDGVIKLVSFLKENNISTQFVGPNSKSTILALTWHPEEESQLVYGTSEGQVGIVDVQTKKYRNFSSFHSSNVYTVDFGPPINPSKYGITDDLCIYSIGGWTLFMRSPSNLMTEPVDLMKVLPTIGPNPKPTDFAFSPDNKLMAIGYSEGHISVYDIQTETLKIKIEAVRKIVQHLIWKPFSGGETSYVLGVGSGEIVVYVFDLTKSLQTAFEDESTVTVLQATRELSGHRSRVTWLSWSSHKDDLLATASYDHTVQVWNSKTGQPICCYGGHPNRIFRVEFCPTEPRALYSFAEENAVHKWYTKDIKTLLPKDAKALSKGRSRPRVNGEKEPDTTTESTSDVDSPPGLGRKGKSAGPPKSMSYFPAFHSVSIRKKSFLHVCILVLREELQIVNDFTPTVAAEETEDDTQIFPNIDRKKILNGILAKYADLLPNMEINEEDVATYLDLFGDVDGAYDALTREMDIHRSKENFNYVDEMHVWEGTLEAHIKLCAKNGRLTPFLVSVAPSISRRFWEFACLAYSEQLDSKGETILAASYLLCLKKEIEAVRLLASKHHFREAVLIARTKLSFNADLIAEITEEWARRSNHDGNFELATVLYMSIGSFEMAARSMSRRTEIWSLMLGRELYELAGNAEMCEARSADVFKEALRKNKLKMFKTFLDASPGLQWLKPLYLIVNYLIDAINEVVIPSVENFNTKRTYKEPLACVIKDLWLQNDCLFEGKNINKYLVYFPLDLATVSAPDSKSMIMFQFWLPVSVAVSILVAGLGGENDTEAWVTATEFLLSSAANSPSPLVSYQMGCLLFQEHMTSLTLENLTRCLFYCFPQYLPISEEELPEYFRKDYDTTKDIAKCDTSEKQDEMVMDMVVSWQFAIILSELNCLYTSSESANYDSAELKAYIEKCAQRLEECKQQCQSSETLENDIEGVSGKTALEKKWKNFSYADWNHLGHTTEQIIGMMNNLKQGS